MRAAPKSNSAERFSLVVLILILAILAAAVTVPAQVNGVDTEFDAVIGLVPGSGFLVGMQTQSDGKMFVIGTFDYISGTIRNKIVRLNADQSIDSSFNCAICRTGVAIGIARGVVMQTDGRVLVSVRSESDDRYKLHRLLPDGSLDSSFSSPFNQQGLGSEPVAILPNGKIYAATGESSPGFVRFTLYRLNPNGLIDNSFTPLQTNGTPRQSFAQVTVLPNEKLMISGAHAFGNLFRVNTDGSQDFTFSPPILTNSTPLPTMISQFNLEPDGKISFTGVFESVNGVSRNRCARLNADGSVDLQFSLDGDTLPVSLKRLQNGKYIVNAAYISGQKFARLNSDGSRDNTFSSPNDLRDMSSWILDEQERVVFYGYYNDVLNRISRLNTDGSKDNSFGINVADGGSVFASALQPDGKIIISGNFHYVNNTQSERLARLNPDGTIDPGFTAVSTLVPSQIVVQPDGKILTLTPYNDFGTPVAQIRRLNPNGSSDGSFSVDVQRGNTMALQPDGKILVGGGNMVVGGFGRSGLVRLNGNGSVDTAFSPFIGNPFLNAVLVQDDGKIIVAGNFSSVNGISRTNIARINGDGSLDNGFNAGNSLSATVSNLVRQPNGAYVVSAANMILRLETSGTPDSTFQAPVLTPTQGIDSINAIVLQANGRLVIGGAFTGPRRNILRLMPNGSLDISFVPEADNAVFTLLKLTGEKIIVGGPFENIGNVNRLGIARLGSGTSPFDFDGDGRADVGVFRQSNGYWYLLPSTGGFSAQNFGISEDISVPADYDGDGKTDIGIFRPSTGTFWWKRSIDGVFNAQQWGAAGDIPRPGDFDADGRADFIVYRPSNSNWYRLGTTSGFSVLNFGAPGDLPLNADFDGDGRFEPAIFRPSTGVFWFRNITTGAPNAIQWGQNGDIPVPADYDGDGKTDAAVFRPSNGVWYVRNSSNGSFFGVGFGLSGDRPVAADYDGDGRADVAVFRPSSGVWYVLQSTSGFTAVQFGIGTDVAIANSYVP